VNNLALSWVTRYTGSGAGGRGGLNIKSTPLLVNGILYFTAPNNVWAADARTGRELWHYEYPPNTGSTIGNRGVGMYGNWLYFETPDSNLVSLDARTGKQRWKVQIADPNSITLNSRARRGRQSHHRRHRWRPSDNPGFLQSRSRNRRPAVEMGTTPAGRPRDGYLARRIFRAQAPASLIPYI
jgi:alcohol dehydrogenase (cytochrome c)